MAGSNSNKKQVFYIHGGSAYSEYKNFLNYLKNEPIRNLPWSEEAFAKGYWSKSLVEDLGDSFEVFAPRMPNKYNAKYTEWKIWFERHFEYLRDDITLLGWSQGGMFLAKYLVENDVPFKIKNIFFVATPFGTANYEGEDGGDFMFDLERVTEISKKVKNIFIFHSKDDFVVPFSHAESLYEALPESEFITFEDKNHFLIEEFPELIDKIKVLT